MSSSSSAVSWRDGGLPLLVLLALGLGLKLAAGFAALESNPLATDLTSDSLYYMERAHGLAGEWDDPLADESYHLPPLYPLVLAVTGTSVTAVLVLQALAGTALLALLWCIARRRLSRRAALLTVALTLAYGALTFFETKVLGDSLATFLLVAVIAVGDRLAETGAGTRTGAGAARKRRRTAALMGALVTLCALLRPQALLLIPLLFAWLLGRTAAAQPGGRQAAFSFLLAAALLLVPSTLHNLQAGAGFAPVSDNGGVNLWLANSGPLSGTFATDDTAFGDIAQQSRAAWEAAARMGTASTSAHPLDAAEVGHRLGRAAVTVIVEEPLTFLHRVGLRALALVEDFETGIVTVPAVEAPLIAPLRILVLPFAALFALFAAALVLGVPARLARAAPCAPLVAVSLMVVVTTLLFFHYSRFRLPLVPILALAAGGLVDVLGTRRAEGHGRHLVLALVAAAMAAAVSWLPADHHAPTLAGGHATLGESHLRAGLRAADSAAAPDPDPDPDPADSESDPDARLRSAERDLNRALDEARRALDIRPGFLRAEELAAHALVRLQHYEEAAVHLDRIAAHLPQHVPLLILRARLLVETHPDNPFTDIEAARVLLQRLRGMRLDGYQLSQVAQLQARLPPPKR